MRQRAGSSRTPRPPLPAALLRAPQWEPPPSLLCRFSCSSFSSSSFSSSSGPQSGRSAPFTVSAPRPRPPRAAAGRGPPARPAPPHSGGAGLGVSRPARVADSAQGAGEGTGCAAAAGPPSCAGPGGGGIPARRGSRLGAAGRGRAGRCRRLLRLLLLRLLLLTSQGPRACLPPSLALAVLWSQLPLVFRTFCADVWPRPMPPLTAPLPRVYNIVGTSGGSELGGVGDLRAQVPRPGD